MTADFTDRATTYSGIRRYSGEHTCHAHDYVQIMFAVQGRMELEINGRSAFADMSIGMVIPAGVEHGFETAPGTRMFVMELPHLDGVDQVRRFAVTAACHDSARRGDPIFQLAQVLQAPKALLRRGIDLKQLDAILALSLHEPWSTKRMAQIFFLSPQRFHARMVELTGRTPQDYLRHRRFETAERLLRHGMSLEATALAVGYRHASALSFALKRDRQFSTRQLRLH